MAPIVIPDHNHFYPQVGMRVCDGRYEFLRPLGSGQYSTTWLTFDHDPQTTEDPPRLYYAVKILTREGTELNRDGIMNELAFYRALKANSIEDCFAGVPVLLDEFEIQGFAGPHLCLAFEAMGIDVTTFRMTSPTKALKPYIVKKIIQDVSEAIEGLHENRIIHTDVKGDNVLVRTFCDNESLAEEIARSENKVIGEFDVEGATYYIYANNPLPAPCGWDISHTTSEQLDYELIDLGQGQWAGEQPTVDIMSPITLRPPEVLIGSAFGPRVDIWALGCLTFELLVGDWLFHPAAGENWTIEEDLLAQIFAITGQRFSPVSLSRAMFKDSLLDAEGNLLHRKELPPTSLEERLASYNILPEVEIEKAAKFIRRCLQLEISERPTASEILMDEWLRGWVCNH